MSEALTYIQQKIAACCRRVERDANSVTLVAVSKTFEADAIEPLLKAGHRVFGENRVQEALTKWPGLKSAYPEIELHLIGPLQTNKAREAVRLFDLIESVDRPKIARKLATVMAEENRKIPVYLQVNIGEEPQKSGILPSEFPDFVILCRDELGLDVRGAMCIPPQSKVPAPYFALLSKLADRAGLEVRSQGMSADYEVAISQGATHIRLGSALFGTRSWPEPS